MGRGPPRPIGRGAAPCTMASGAESLCPRPPSARAHTVGSLPSSARPVLDVGPQALREDGAGHRRPLAGWAVGHVTACGGR
eukprot:2511956-Alexandrium_andersonii.AAC.1